MTTRYAIALAVFALAVLASGAASNPPVVVPAYSAAYQPGSGDAKRVVEILESIDRRLANMERRAGFAAPNAASRRAERDQVLVAKCAGCHTPARIEEGKDGGVILFTSDDSKTLLPLAGRTLTDVTAAVRGRSMPKGRPPLTPAELSLFE